jgi:WD40 repeat protein
VSAFTLALVASAAPAAPLTNSPAPSISAIASPTVVSPKPTAPEMVLQLGHDGEVDAIAASRDGTKLISAGRDGMLKVWRANTGELTASERASTGWIYSAALSPDATCAATGDDRGFVGLWNTTTGENVFKLNISDAPTPILSLGFSPDGTQVIAGSADGGLRSIGVGSKRVERSWRFPGLRVDTAAFSPDGRFILIGLGRGIDTGGHSPAPGGERIEVHLASDGSRLRAFPLPPASRGSCAFSPDSRKVIACPPDGSIVTFDIATGKLASKWKCDDYVPLTAQYSASGASLLTTGYGGELRLWDASTGKLSRVISGVTPYGGGLSATWVGRTGAIAAGTHTGDILEWTASTGYLIRAIDGYQGPRITSLALSASGAALAVASGSRTSATATGDVALIANEPQLLGRSLTLPAAASSIAFAPYGNSLLIADPRRVSTWDYTTGVEQTIVESKTGGLFPRASFSSDGLSILVAAATGGVKFYNPVTRAVSRTVDTGPDSFCGFALSPDRTRLATLTQRLEGEGAVVQLRLWDAATGSLLATPAVYKSAAPVVSDGRVAMAISPDGKFLVVGSEVRSLATGKLLTRLPDASHTAAFSRDTRTLVTDTGSIWDSWTRRMRAGLAMPSDARLLSIAVARDGARVLGGFDDGTIRVWNASDGALMLTVHLLRSIGGRTSTREWVAIAPDGRYEASSNGEQSIRWRTGASLLPGVTFRTQMLQKGLIRLLFSTPNGAPTPQKADIAPSIVKPGGSAARP